MTLRTKVMSEREARQFLFAFAATLLELAGDSADPIHERYEDHTDPKNAEKESALLVAQIPYVAAQLRKRAGDFA